MDAANMTSPIGLDYYFKVNSAICPFFKPKVTIFEEEGRPGALPAKLPSLLRKVHL